MRKFLQREKTNEKKTLEMERCSGTDGGGGRGVEVEEGGRENG